MMDMNIYLIGFMGTGKSTVGKELAKAIGWPCIDMDSEISKREGLTIPEIFAQKGEAYFREAESKLLKELSDQDGLVVTTGGGVVTRESNRELLQRGFIISLYANKDVIRERVSQTTGRPLLAGTDMDKTIDALLEQRKAYYDQANLKLDTSTKSVPELVAEIVEVLRRNPENPLR
jgi:shikimate kinase